MVVAWADISELEDPTNQYAEYSINTATSILWALSGRKYNGVKTVTEQYTCRQSEAPMGCSWENSNVFRDISNNYYGYIVKASLFGAEQGIGTRFRLRQYPVRKILLVSVGGNVIPASSYSVKNNRILSIESEKCMSLCSSPIVQYKYGVNPPDAGKLAAIELANELVNSYSGNSCGLPERVSNISRQGLSIEMYDPQDFLDKGRLGLYKVDLFIASVNPGKANKPAKVFTTDTPRGYST